MDVWQMLWVTLSLLLIVEGLLPFLSPTQWRRLVLRVAQTDDRSLRLSGLVLMLTGTALLYAVH